MKNRFFIFIFLPTVVFFIFAFWLRGIFLLDPDFGWHIRMGELIQKIGIPKTDPFSYTMPSYPFVDHEWLTNVVLAKLFSIIHYKSLAIIFAGLAMSSLLIRLVSVSKWVFVPFVLAAVTLMLFVGVRTQVITWMFFSVLLVILYNPKVWKWPFILPLFFLAWSNLHGGFGIGFIALSIVIATRIYEFRKILYKDIAILFLSVGTTFINPYGVQIWWELWMQLSDTSLRWSIAEWKPAIFVPSFALWIFIAFSVIIISRYRIKFHLSQVVLFFCLLLLGILSIRHIPLFILMALPMSIKAMEWFSKEATAYKGGTERLRKVYIIFSIGVSLVAVIELILNLQVARSFEEHSYYPVQAIKFLKNNKSCGELLSVYQWGGYLIWKIPEKKVFIDGRMPSWRREYSPPSESIYAFEEYYRLMRGKIPVKRVIEKYNIDTFLLPTVNKGENGIFKKLSDLEARIFRGEKKDEGNFIEQIIDEGMEEIYKDKVSVIYRKKQSILALQDFTLRSCN